MKKTRASTTAEGIAFVRALESSKPAGERICCDPLARKLISPAFYLLGKLFVDRAERKGPGVLGFLAARCRYIDDYLQACLETGLDQLVILGAGLDSRAYRFEQLAGCVRVFEVDHPATQQAKISKLAKVLGSLPEHVTFVPIDFNKENRYTGEGLAFGIEEGQVEEFLLARGYSQVQNVTSQDLERMYFTGANEARVIASIYAIAHAVVGK